jgi:hypothetical protein
LTEQYNVLQNTDKLPAEKLPETEKLTEGLPEKLP